MPKKKSPPLYRLHKARNCAVVTIAGRNHYLGPYGSEASKEKYARLIAEHCSGAGGVSHPAPCSPGSDLTINELVAKYWTDYVQTYHSRNGKPTERQYHIRTAMRFLCKLYGRTPASEFGPKRLKLVREDMINQRVQERGTVGREYINGHVSIIKRMFRWAVAEELIPVAVHQALETVDGIHKGRDPRVRELEKVPPAPEEDVRAVVKVVSPQIGTMIELLRLTAMRPDEATIMRPVDIDRSGPVWIYRPESHKTEHLGFEKLILLGPQAQKILATWLDREPTAYLFDPREVLEATLARRRNGKPSTRKAKPRRSRQIRPHYDDESFCQAVVRGCEKARVRKWTPRQLRHTAATAIRQKYGLEAAKLILGHQSMVTTEIYAEKDLGKAIDIVKELG